MEIDEKVLNRYIIIGTIFILGVLVFFLIQTVIVPVLTGLILSYICFPVYKKFKRLVKYEGFAAGLVLTLIVIIIIVPLWFIIPITISQFYNIYVMSLSLDFNKIFITMIPGASPEFISNLATSLNSLIYRTGSDIFTSIVDLKNLPNILIDVFIVGFVFFFGLRDSETLVQIAKEISPLNKSKERLLVNQFKNITDSLFWGNIVVGVIQGLLAGVGMMIFGIDNVLILTLLAIFFSIIPVLGPFIVYLPVSVVFFVSNRYALGIWFLIYNFTIVSTVDNFLRSYIVSKKTKMNSAIVFVGMMAGLYTFGIVGMLLGPLILSYFLIILQLYKDKALNSLFVKEEEKPQSSSG